MYFTMLQTMAQNYSASDKEKERHKIICKKFEIMQSFENAQADLKEYNQIVKLDVIDLTSGDNGDVDATPDVAKKDSSAVMLFSGDRRKAVGRKPLHQRTHLLKKIRKLKRLSLLNRINQLVMMW